MTTKTENLLKKMIREEVGKINEDATADLIKDLDIALTDVEEILKACNEDEHLRQFSISIQRQMMLIFKIVDKMKLIKHGK